MPGGTTAPRTGGAGKRHRVRSIVLWESDGATCSPTDAEGAQHHITFGNDNGLHIDSWSYGLGSNGGTINPVHFLEIPNAINVDHCQITVVLSITAITPDPFVNTGAGLMGSGASVHIRPKRGTRAGSQIGLLPVAEDGASLSGRGYSAFAGAGGAGVVSQRTHPWPHNVGGFVEDNPSLTNYTPMFTPGLLPGSATITADGQRMMLSFEINTVGSHLMSISGADALFMRFYLYTGQWGPGDAPTSLTLAGKIVATIYEQRRGDKN